MSENTGIVKANPTTLKQRATVGVYDRLISMEEPFDLETYRQSIRSLKDEVLESGETVFLPLPWGTPDVEEGGEFSPKENKLKVNYHPDYLIVFGSNTLRKSKSSDVTVGPFTATNFTSEPDPMTNKDVDDRIQAIQDSKPYTFPEHPNSFNTHAAVSVLTDEKGLAKISINCPYPFSPSEETGIKHDDTLPVPFNYSPGIKSKLFLAAVLNEMGLDQDLVFKAVAYQPRVIDESEGTEFKTDPTDDASSMSSIPALRKSFDFDVQSMRSSWKPEEGVGEDLQEVYRTVLTSARFDDEGNVTFKTS